MIPITILSRLRNEKLLLPDFLNHIDKFGDEFFFYDDCSTDNSVDIIENHPKTKKVICNHFHSNNQSFVQTAQRKLLLDYARKHSKNRWFLLIEPDERIEFDFKKLDKYNKDGVNGIFLRLFDAYLTEQDKKSYRGGQLKNLREYFGPEFREIGFLFRRDKASYDLKIPGVRQPNITGKTVTDGICWHYGKCLSIKQWEDKCKYYIKSMPSLKNRWEARRGKAIHELSDFNHKLLTWRQIKDRLKLNSNGLIKI